MLTRRQPISITEAQDKLKAVSFPNDAETIAVSQANHRVLAQTITAPFSYPHFRRSGYDGYAIRSEDDHNFPKQFQVVGDVPAGATFEGELGENETVRIMTGAYVPTNAGKVIMLEQTREIPDDASQIKMMVTEKHSNITEIGSEFQEGDSLIEKDAELNPGGLAILSAFGITEVVVYRQPKVAIITTGTELMAPVEPLQAGKIYNSNGPLIRNLVVENGGIVTQETQLIDDAALLAKTLTQAIAENDIVITDGGVSVGDFDFIGDTARTADELLFNKLKMRPGSVTTAFVQNQTLVMALSGNPGACYTAFYLFVEPLLARFAHGQSKVREITATLAAPYQKTNGYDRILRGTYQEVAGQYQVVPNGSDKSSALGNLQTTTCLIEIPHSNEPIKENAQVTAWRLPFK